MQTPRINSIDNALPQRTPRCGGRSWSPGPGALFGGALDVAVAVVRVSSKNLLHPSCVGRLMYQLMAGTPDELPGPTTKTARAPNDNEWYEAGGWDVRSGSWAVRSVCVGRPQKTTTANRHLPTTEAASNPHDGQKRTLRPDKIDNAASRPRPQRDTQHLQVCAPPPSLLEEGTPLQTTSNEALATANGAR